MAENDIQNSDQAMNMDTAYSPAQTASIVKDKAVVRA